MLRKRNVLVIAVLLALLIGSVVPAQAGDGPNLSPETSVYRDGKVRSMEDLKELRFEAPDLTALRTGEALGSEEAADYQSGSYRGDDIIADLTGVYPPDNRWLAYRPYIAPNRAVAQLTILWPDNTIDWCTGFMYGPNSLITAGHCAYSHVHGGWFTSMLVELGIGMGKIAAVEGQTARVYASNAVVPSGWAADANVSYDIASISLDWIDSDGDASADTSLGWGTWWFAVSPCSYDWYWLIFDPVTGAAVGCAKHYTLFGGILTDVPGIDRDPALDPRRPNQLFQGKYWTIGYPIDKPIDTQWKTVNDKAIWVSDADFLYYYLDTGMGWEGAPIYQDYNPGGERINPCFRADGPCSPLAVAVHNGIGEWWRARLYDWDRDGDTDLVFEFANRGLRLRATVLNWLSLHQWDDASWPPPPVAGDWPFLPVMPYFD